MANHMHENRVISTANLATPKIVTIDLKRSYIGEILNYSYIKVSVEPAGNSENKSITPLKGSLYEAITSKSFRIIGSYNSENSNWALNCFDSQNRLYCTFIGKENGEGNIEGKWIQKKNVRNFYLKRQ